MGYPEVTKESFLENVKDFEMKIIKDDGVYRHIRFGKPNDGNMHFNLTTWPYHVCYSGDMGTYVFSRIEDMMYFFDQCGDELGINCGYWGEKLQSESVFGEGKKEWDADEFRRGVQKYFDDYVEDNDLHVDDEETAELYSEIEDEVLCNADNEWDAVAAIHNFYHPDFNFDEFFMDYSCQKYTYHFMWCLWALAWSTKMYRDSVK